jgi:hypothetical protein
MPGAIGGAMMFFVLLAGLVIVGAYVFSYASHIFLTVIESTATGFEDVSWPDEPYVDWLWKGVYVLWLAALWLIPLLLVGTRIGEQHVAFWAAGLGWLLFPISLLSSMSASSRWFVFSPSLLPRLAQRFGSLLTFYLLTAPLLAVVALAIWWNNRTLGFLTIPIAAFAVATGLLIYARLFGRLALLVRHTADRREPAPVRRPRNPEPAQVRAASYDPVRSGKRIRQPSELPPVAAPDPDARTGYNLRLDDAPQVSGLPIGHGWKVHEPPTSYDIADGPHHVDPPRGPIPDRVIKPSEYEKELARTDKSPDVPEHPWLNGTFSFPFPARNRGPLVWLTFGLCVFGVILKLMQSFTPA